MSNCLLILITLFFQIMTSQEVNQKASIDLIIDADTANEVDDLFALVRAINEPKFNLLAITSAQFHTSPLASDNSVNESQAINEAVVKLMDKANIDLPLGSNTPLDNENQPAISPASNYMVKSAKNATPANPLHLVILGSCTNVASAILTDASIIPNIKVYYIGFWHNATTNEYNKNEFNSRNDAIAVNVLLNTTGLDFNVMSATTCQHLVFNKTQVEEQLKLQGKPGEYLLDRWNTYERWWTKEDPEKTKWIMWDVAIIEALARPELAKSESFFTPNENIQRQIDIYTYIDVPQMTADYWESFK